MPRFQGSCHIYSLYKQLWKLGSTTSLCYSRQNATYLMPVLNPETIAHVWQATAAATMKRICSICLSQASSFWGLLLDAGHKSSLLVLHQRRYLPNNGEQKWLLHSQARDHAPILLAQVNSNIMAQVPCMRYSTG